ncbi:hypothetical protein VTN96DRAFT_1338 [Rasamsonia emersonii]
MAGVPTSAQRRAASSSGGLLYARPVLKTALSGVVSEYHHEEGIFCHSSPVATARLKNYHKLINLVVATSAETVAWWTSVVEEDETGQLEMLGSARARAE